MIDVVRTRVDLAELGGCLTRRYLFSATWCFYNRWMMDGGCEG